MSRSNRQIQYSEHLEEKIIIDSTGQDHYIGKTVRICWNTGEEKNCVACCLSKGCKAKV